MKPLTIPDAKKVVRAVQKEIKESKDCRYIQRLHGILLVAQGKTCPQVARLLGRQARTVQLWVHTFKEEGLSGLKDKSRPGRPPRLTEEQMAQIDRVLRSTPEEYGLNAYLWDGKTLSAFILKEFNVHLGVRQCQRVFHKLGFRYRKPRPLIAGTDPAVKKAFLNDVRKMIKNPKIEVWVQDEVFFKLFGTTCKMWIPPEDSDPFVLHNSGREHIKYFGALRLRDGKFVYMKVEGTFNGDNFFTFLKYLRKITARSSRKTVLLLDRASYHRAKVHEEWRNKCRKKFCLVLLPSASPELNPIERVWKYTRRKCTHNRYFSTIEDLTATVESQFNQWRQKSEALQRLCAIS